MKRFVIGLFLAAVALVPSLHAEPFTTTAPIAPAARIPAAPIWRGGSGAGSAAAVLMGTG